MAVIYQVINLTVAMFLPRWIIYEYGSEVNGLTSNINQYLDILNLLQAGLLAASAFDMYKPIYAGDNQQTGRIYYSARRTYFRLSYCFFFLAVIITPVALGGKAEAITMREIMLSVLILTTSGALNFRYYCSYDLIFSVYQDKYVLFIAQLAERLIYYAVVYISIAFHMHFLCMYAGHLAGTAIKLLYLKYKFSAKYEKSLIKYKGLTDYKPKNRFHLFGNQIVFRVMDSLPIVVVTLIYNLSYASIYSVYVMITGVFKSVFNAVLNAIAPSIGMLYAEDNEAKCSNTFEMLQMGCSFLLNIVVICIAVLLLPFISIYIGAEAKNDYVCSQLALWISVYTILYTYFNQFDIIINVTGTYNLTLKSNFYLGALTAVVAVACGLADFQLIYLGVSLFYFVAIILRYRLINGRLFSLTKKCLIRPVVTLFFFGVAYFFSGRIFPYASASLLHWLISAVVVGCCGTVVSLLYLVLADRKQAKHLLQLLLSR